MKYILMFLFPLYLLAIENPYKTLQFDEKFNLLFNYFLNEELKSKLPQKPKMREVENLGEIKRESYERYFTYVQRVKFLKEENQREKDEAFEEYAGKAGYYNGKVSNLKSYYLKQGHISKIMQNSINKTFKVFYGNPKIKDLTLMDGKIKASLYNKTFYGFNYTLNKDVLIDIPEDLQENFWNRYKSAKIRVLFKEQDDLLRVSGMEAVFESKTYRGVFLDKTDLEIKLDIKINDDIFQPIIIGEKK